MFNCRTVYFNRNKKHFFLFFLFFFFAFSKTAYRWQKLYPPDGVCIRVGIDFRTDSVGFTKTHDQSTRNLFSLRLERTHMSVVVVINVAIERPPDIR